MNQYNFFTTYKERRGDWQGIDRFVITKGDDGYWPASIVRQRLQNWLVMYFHNTKKGESPSK
jgi:hypothetical protein